MFIVEMSIAAQQDENAASDPKPVVTVVDSLANAWLVPSAITNGAYFIALNVCEANFRLALPMYLRDSALRPNLNPFLFMMLSVKIGLLPPVIETDFS